MFIDYKIILQMILQINNCIIKTRRRKR